MTIRNAENLDADYASAGFGGKLVPGKKGALIVIDVVMAYLDPKSPLYAGVEAALDSNVRLVEAARKAGVPVIYTIVEYEPGGQSGGLFFKKVPALKAFVKGNPQGAFPPSLQPAENELVVTKQYPSAFFATHLASTLYAAGVDTVFLTGFSTSGCVRASALDALCLGFVPFVIREACGDRDVRPHEQNLFDMQAKMAEVVSEAEAIELFGKFTA